MLRRSVIVSEIVNSLRRYRRKARHHSIIKKHSLTYYAAENSVIAELRSRDLLSRVESATPWAPKPLYPIGGAAGALFLYLLLRGLREFSVGSVLELGAGQTTLLLDAWAQAVAGRVMSFEHDEFWAATIGSRISASQTRVLHLPLVDHPTSRGSVRWYTPPDEALMSQEKFDLLLVDGPVGTPHLSRYGIVEHIPDWMRDDWAIIWDDLHRPPDLESFAALITRLRAMGIPHEHLLLEGDRTVGLIFTKKFSAFRYMW